MICGPLVAYEGVVAEDNRLMTYKTRKTASEQFAGIAFVVFVHISIVYVIASGLAHQAVDAVMGPIETTVIEEAKKVQEELPPPPPRLEQPPPYVPPPDILLAAEPLVTNTTAIHDVTSVKVPPPPVAPAAPDVEARLDPKARRNAWTESDYPAVSKRLNEEGDVIVAILVNADGSVGDIKVEKSSGFQRLDEAALDFYRKAKYLPGMKDGKPMASWKTLKIKYQLKK